MIENNKEPEEKKTLTGHEWVRLRAAVSGHIHLFIRERGWKNELPFLMHLFNRTLSFNKFGEVIKISQLQKGMSKPDLFIGIPCHRSTLHRMRLSLLRRKLIHFEGKRSNLVQAGLYRFNIVGMLDAILSLSTDDEIHKMMLVNIRDKVNDLYEKYNWERGKVIMSDIFNPKIKEGAIKKHKEASERNKAKKQKKREDGMRGIKEQGVKDKPIWILDEMREFCREFEVGLHDVWTDKEFKNAVRWLGYCRRANVDPVETLRDVCKFWPHFKHGQLYRETGEKIYLPDAVSFSHYFTHRRIIGAWIEDNRNAPERFQISNRIITDVDAWVKEKTGGRDG